MLQVVEASVWRIGMLGVACAAIVRVSLCALTEYSLASTIIWPPIPGFVIRDHMLHRFAILGIC